MCVLVPSSAVYTMEYYYLVSYNLYHSANNWNMKSRAMQTLTDITTCKTTCKVGAQTCWHTLLILWINFHVITYFSILASICRCHKKAVISSFCHSRGEMHEYYNNFFLLIHLKLDHSMRITDSYTYQHGLQCSATLGLEVLWELIGYFSYQFLISFALLCFLTEYPREALKNVILSMVMIIVRSVSHYQLA